MRLLLAVILAGLAFAAPSAQAALSSPQLGKTVNVRPVKGTVFVGGDRLTGPRQIPVGSRLDARGGTVRLTSARDKAGHLQSGRFSRGRFRVTQSSTPSDRGVTVLRLVGGNFKTCHGGTRTIRRLRANVDGRFRTRGRYASATAHGTKWTMTDTCSGTLTVVARGTVTVENFRSGKTVVVRAGERYRA